MSVNAYAAGSNCEGGPAFAITREEQKAAHDESDEPEEECISGRRAGREHSVRWMSSEEKFMTEVLEAVPAVQVVPGVARRTVPHEPGRLV